MAQEYTWTVRVRGDISNAVGDSPYAVARTVTFEQASPDPTATLFTTEATDSLLATGVLQFLLNAPTLIAPPDEQELDYTQAQLFEWQHNSVSPPTNPQTRFCFERQLAGVFGYESPADTQDYNIEKFSEPTCAAFSPNGSFFAVGYFFSPRLQVFNSTETNVVLTPPVQSNVRDLAFSPSGNILAVVGADGLLIYDTTTWALVPATPVVGANCRACAFSPNGTYLAIAHDLWSSRVVTIYRVADWALVTGFPAALNSTGWAVAFSADSSVFAYADAHVVRVRNVGTLSGSTWTSRFDVTLPSGVGFDGARGLAFSPTDDWLAIAHTSAPSLEIYNYITGTQVSGVAALPAAGRECSFSPDGSLLAAAHFSDGSSSGVTLLSTADWNTTYSVARTAPTNGVFCSFTSNDRLLYIQDTDFPAVAWPLTITEPGFATEYWNGTGWGPFEVYLESTDEELLFPADAWNPVS